MIVPYRADKESINMDWLQQLNLQRVHGLTLDLHLHTSTYLIFSSLHSSFQCTHTRSFNFLFLLKGQLCTFMVGIFITFKKKTSMFTVWGRYAHSDRQSTEACLYVIRKSNIMFRAVPWLDDTHDWDGGTRRGCPQGWSVGKTKLTRNRKIDRGVGGPARNLFPEKNWHFKSKEAKIIAFRCNLNIRMCFFWEIKDVKRCLPT